jgi:hypothetical protein
MKDAYCGIPLTKLADMNDELESELFFSEGVLSREQERRFDAVKGSANAKIERLGRCVLQQEARLVAIDHEQGRLAARRASIEKRIAGRKEFIRLMMERFDKRSVDGALCTVTLQRNAVTVARSLTSHAGPQRDLFASGRGVHRPSHRGNHVRIR